MIGDVGQLRKIYEEDFAIQSAAKLITNTQEYLNYYYPKKLRELVYQLDLSEQKLTGNLNLKDFTRLEEINITGNPQLGIIENKQSGIVVCLDASLQSIEECPESKESPAPLKKELNSFKSPGQSSEEKKNY